MKVAISYVSVEQAQLNMQSELPHWDFDKTHSEAVEIWDKALDRIQVETNTEKDKIKFLPE